MICVENFNSPSGIVGKLAMICGQRNLTCQVV